MENIEQKKPSGCLKFIWIILISLLIFVTIGLIFFRDPPSAASIANEKYDELKKMQDDSLMNCYITAELFLKKNLKDPDSYEEIEHSSYFVSQKTLKDPYMQVTIQYRAKNGFGGMNIEKKAFSFDKSGNLNDVIDLDK